ncbi:MAG: hypothetical protein VXW23_01400 [Planctomycetota bacterium]|nr:hypothetical protein [Planctomycetota bacterium]
MKVLHRDRSPIRIGDAVFSTGKAGDETQRIIDAIQHFQNLGMNFTKELINPKTCWRAVATSALREADDRDEVIQIVQENTQIKINILSGEQEAQWALRSVAEARPLQGSFLVADLGGGSLELILGQDNQMLRCSSFQLGAVRWQHALDSNTAEALDRIHHEQDRLRTFIGSHKALTCIGLGGAFRTMRQITGESSFEVLTLEQWRTKLAPLSPTERSQKHGLPKDRADIILPAIDALCLTLDAVQGTSWTVVDGVGGIADALAQQLLQEQRDPADECTPD